VVLAEDRKLSDTALYALYTVITLIMMMILFLVYNLVGFFQVQTYVIKNHMLSQPEVVVHEDEDMGVQGRTTTEMEMVELNPDRRDRDWLFY